MGDERIRAAEVVATLCLATDLAVGLPFEHGLQSTLVAVRLAERLGVAAETASQAYSACLLFYAGCTADADLAAELFPGDIHVHFTPAMFGSRPEILRATALALAPPGSEGPVRAARIARGLPRAVRAHRRHAAAICEVGQMLTDRLGLPASVRALFAHLTERWDGKGEPAGLAGDELPLPVRIVHVARDAAFHALAGGPEHAAGVVRERAGGAFDPAIAAALADGAAELLAVDPDASAWEETLAREPAPWPDLDGATLDTALAAMGDFADLASPYFVGHSTGVAALAAEAARNAGLVDADVTLVRRAAHVHDLGRVAVPTRIWLEPRRLTADEWERVRLHPYHTERVLSRSAALAALAPVASAHHERLDGSGYHRGAPASALPPTARLLAAADAYHAMAEPRPHRPALTAAAAAETLAAEARAGRLDPAAVAAVLEAAGQRAPRLERPAGLTEREAQVVGLLARGLQTKQVAGALGISAKTADRHVQNAYAKIGVSTRAAATLFAMEHGLAVWGELPIGGAAGRS
ncbi:MAG TPA: HD domain-containing phosphohydrolase [Gaiellaceae bacterium]|nr:HD domain-containing phosphohydrolase [Gaiellaceae bacterium]